MAVPAPSAFAGVFDPHRSHRGDVLRGRLSQALEPDGVATGLDSGPLSIAWTTGVEMGERDGVLCLLDGRIHDRATLSDASADAPAAELIAGASESGDDLLARLRGDFALLLWDHEAETGLVARDHLGGRPLFLHHGGGVTAFASEVRNLRRLMPQEPGPDRIAIASWLMTAPIPADRTLFDGIAPLPPAARLALTPDAGAPRRYWTPRYRRRSGVTVEEAGAEVRLALERGVRRRMGPPTESALLLSGGIDSASVAGVACAGPEGDPRPGRSYSAVFPRHPRIDEGPLIREIAAALGIRATGLQLNGGGILAGALPYLRAWELTPSTPNLFFLHPLLARAAADGTSVLLDGEGGDAIFWFTTALLADRVKRGRLLSAWSLAGRFPEYGVPTTWRTRVNQLRQWGRPRDFNPPPPAWLTLEAPDASATSGAAPRAEGAPRWWRAHLDAVLGIGSQIVHDTSRRHAALSGIEPRHPLLDVDLIELALSLPPELAFERRYNRPVLRAAVAGLVPDAARLRPYKSNFDVVLFDALAADLPAIERLLLEPGAETPAFADRAGVEAQLAHPPDAPGERREWSMSIWHLTTMECWLRQRAGADPVPPALAPLLAPADYSFIDLR